MDRIKQWRLAQPLTIDSAGAMIGVSGVQWHRYEAGTRRIPAEKVAALSQVTGIPASELRPDIFGEPERAA